MDPEELEQYLHEHIPLSAAMQASVKELQPDRVVLTAPLKPNINHRETVFGGSASALATLAAWSLVHVCLQTAGISARLVIQHNRVDYERPLTGDFGASAVFTNPEGWSRFLQTLVRRGRARIDVTVSLEQDGQVAGRFHGRFVALDVGRA
jgi:thioesterase domain-containing protein